jgi:hypothetical protein
MLMLLKDTTRKFQQVVCSSLQFSVTRQNANEIEKKKHIWIKGKSRSSSLSSTHTHSRITILRPSVTNTTEIFIFGVCVAQKLNAFSEKFKITHNLTYWPCYDEMAQKGLCECLPKSCTSFKELIFRCHEMLHMLSA